jgi:hypothetical protein
MAGSHLSHNFHIYVTLGEFIKCVTTVYSTNLRILCALPDKLAQELCHLVVPLVFGLAMLLRGVATGPCLRLSLCVGLGMSKTTGRNEQHKGKGMRPEEGEERRGGLLKKEEL